MERFYNFKSGGKGVTPYNRAHLGGLLEDELEESEKTEKRAEMGSETGPWNKNDGKKERERKGRRRERERREGKTEIETTETGLGKYTQEGLLVAVAEDVSLQDPKGRPIQTPEY